MQTVKQIACFWTFLAFLSGWIPAVWAAPPAAATAVLVVGEVRAIPADGVSRILQKGAEVYSGERLETGETAYVRLAFADGGAVVLRPGTSFVVESFVYAGSPKPPAAPIASVPVVAAAPPVVDTADRVALRLLRGGFRAVSGLIGKLRHEQYQVLTPVATIGIRGTQFLGIVCEAACVADPVIQAAMSTLPEDVALGGLVTAVDEGGITLVSQAGGSADVGVKQFLLTTAGGQHLRLSGVPGFLKAETWLSPSENAPVSTGSGSPLPPISTTAAAGAAAALLGVVAGLALDSGDDANDGASSTSTGTATSTSTTTSTATSTSTLH